MQNGNWVLIACICSGCATVYKPCTEGVWDLSKENNAFDHVFVRKCEQKTLKNGRTLNHGRYWGWNAEEHIQVVGKYFLGKRHGRWDYYDDKGKVTHSEFFNQGVQVLDAKHVDPETALPLEGW